MYPKQMKLILEPVQVSRLNENVPTVDEANFETCKGFKIKMSPRRMKLILKTVQVSNWSENVPTADEASLYRFQN